jgi:hypothetical protein
MLPGPHATSGDFLTEPAGVPAVRRRPKPRPLIGYRMPGVVVRAGLHLVAARVPGRSMTGSSGVSRGSITVMSVAGRSLPGWPGM